MRSFRFLLASLVLSACAFAQTNNPTFTGQVSINPPGTSGNVNTGVVNATIGYQVNGSYGTNGFCFLSTGTGTVINACPAPSWGAIIGTLSAQTDLQNALNLLAPIASPVFTGNPKAPTVALSDNSTNIATTAWVKGQNYGAGGGAVWGGITGALASQLDLQAALNALSPIASPTFTGTATAPNFQATTCYLDHNGSCGANGQVMGTNGSTNTYTTPASGTLSGLTANQVVVASSGTTATSSQGLIFASTQAGAEPGVKIQQACTAAASAGGIVIADFGPTANTAVNPLSTCQPGTIVYFSGTTFTTKVPWVNPSKVWLKGTGATGTIIVADPTNWQCQLGTGNCQQRKYSVASTSYSGTPGQNNGILTITTTATHDLYGGEPVQIVTATNSLNNTFRVCDGSSVGNPAVVCAGPTATTFKILYPEGTCTTACAITNIYGPSPVLVMGHMATDTNCLVGGAPSNPNCGTYQEFIEGIGIQCGTTTTAFLGCVALQNIFCQENCAVHEMQMFRLGFLGLDIHGTPSQNGGTYDTMYILPNASGGCDHSVTAIYHGDIYSRGFGNITVDASSCNMNRAIMEDTPGATEYYHVHIENAHIGFEIGSQKPAKAVKIVGVNNTNNCEATFTCSGVHISKNNSISGGTSDISIENINKQIVTNTILDDARAQTITDPQVAHYSWNFLNSVTCYDSTVVGLPSGCSTTFANLGTALNGTTYYCSDCKNVGVDGAAFDSVAVGAGTGTNVLRENGQWRVH